MAAKKAWWHQQLRLLAANFCCPTAVRITYKPQQQRGEIGFAQSQASPRTRPVVKHPQRCVDELQSML